MQKPLIINRYKIKILLAVSLLALISSMSCFAKIKEIRSVEGITEYRLKNGLQILLFPDTSKDTITVNITYRVGSKHENYGETGMAHLLEHLLFKGTPRHPDISKELSEHGAQANGTTWLERTNYYETFKATEENLKWALSMEADRMVNSFVSEKDLESEMTVVRNEFERGENSPTRILLQRIYAAAFDWHNYGNSTIGARADIENVKIENLRAFYEKYYQPDNATLIVAGNIETAKTLKFIKKYFGKIKKPKRVLPEFYTQDPVQDGERKVVLRRVGGEQVLAAAYRIPSGLHEDFAALSILASILGDTPTGRLYKNIVEKQYATQTWAWPNQQKDASLFYFNVNADLKTDMNKTQSLLIGTLENIDKEPITKGELERAKRKILKDIELYFNSSQKISIGLSEWIGIGDWRMLFIHRDRIEKVTLEDVQRVAEYYFTPSNRTLGEFVPTKKPVRAEMPEAVDVEELVTGYIGRKSIAAGEQFDAIPRNIAAREKRVKVGDINLSLLPIKTRGESVFFKMRLNFGNENALKEKALVRDFAIQMLMRGTKRLSREQIQDEFDKLGAQGGVDGGTQSIYVSYETKREQLADVIKLIYEILTTANFPKKEFELLKAQALAKLENDKTDPQALAFNALSVAMNSYPKGHILASMTLEERIKATKSVRLKDVVRFYESLFSGEDITVGVAGDFEPTLIKKTVVSEFSKWRGGAPYKRIKVKHSEVAKLEKNIETPDKKNSVFLAALNLDIDYNHKDVPALFVVTRMLGGGFLDSRLAKRIRQQDGLSYSVGARLSVPKRSKNGNFMVYAISAPENTEKVHQAFLEELKKAREEGFSEEELSASIDGFLDRTKVSLSNNSTLASLLRDNLYDDYSWLQVDGFQEKVRQLTVDQVNAAIKAHLDESKMTIIKAGDFAKLPKAAAKK